MTQHLFNRATYSGIVRNMFLDYHIPAPPIGRPGLRSPDPLPIRFHNVVRKRSDLLDGEFDGLSRS
jgi:hypothetical protein